MNAYLKFLLVLSLIFVQHSTSFGQQKDALKLRQELQSFFLKYKAKNNVFVCQPRMLTYNLDAKNKNIKIYADEYFSQQTFTDEIVRKLYLKLRKQLPKNFKQYHITIFTCGLPIEMLCADSKTNFTSNLWGDIEYNGQPWTSNISFPFTITHGLQNKHISLWASHGRYYDLKRGKWSWQRPNLFCTTEDLFTQTIVVPYLIPMLQNAGAIVFTPRERDWQKEEIIVDNDKSTENSLYEETGEWQKAEGTGFALCSTLTDGENPFEKGSTRMLKTTKGKKYSSINYQPFFKKSGKYAVYVSYKSLPQSIDDAQYFVYHKGQRTEIHVNQTMGDGTWVYIGTFNFDKGCNSFNKIVVTNYSKNKGVVTSDAVRFGGGMGNIEREGMISGLPRALEGARYYAQWAGAPYAVYSSKNGTDDYGDDINTRSYMTNWLAGGSCFVPSLDGKKVPIELSLAIHSDAGYAKDGKSIIGSLSICTTNHNEGKLNAGVSRIASRKFAQALLTNIGKDIKAKYGQWVCREVRDKNYSETRLPEVPSAIFETMSHQSFPDMMRGQDPNFRFTFARSIYKTILKFINEQHGRPYIIQPLTPKNFRVTLLEGRKALLKWNENADKTEPTATPTSYNVYVSMNNGAFDNGRNIRGNSYTIELEPGVLYNFKVTAANRGGESFPTEVLSALYQPQATQTILIVNGFHRLSAPKIINNSSQQGFDINDDIGVSYGPTAGINGAQQCFDIFQMGNEGPGGLGYGGNELAGTFVAGNDFNYVNCHATAIRNTHRFNIASCSAEAVENKKVLLTSFHCVDLLLGLEKDDGHSLVFYKTFKPIMTEQLSNYVANKGKLLVSGAFIGSDMTRQEEVSFLSKVLKIKYNGSVRNNNVISGMGKTFSVYNQINEEHYAAQSMDILSPTSSAYCALQYEDGSSAAVAYKGSDYRTFTMGFPFECIKSEDTRNSIMKGILYFLTQQ